LSGLFLLRPEREGCCQFCGQRPIWESTSDCVNYISDSLLDADDPGVVVQNRDATVGQTAESIKESKSAEPRLGSTRQDNNLLLKRWRLQTMHHSSHPVKLRFLSSQCSQETWKFGAIMFGVIRHLRRPSEQSLDTISNSRGARGGRLITRLGRAGAGSSGLPEGSSLGNKVTSGRTLGIRRGVTSRKGMIIDPRILWDVIYTLPTHSNARR